MKIHKKPRNAILKRLVVMFAIVLLAQFSRVGAGGNVVNIPVLMATDSGYVYPTMVALTSLFDNAAQNTHYDVTIMVPSDFQNDHKNKILMLLQAYERHSIDFVDMGPAFEDAYTDRSWGTTLTITAYYRLLAAIVLRSVKKCIWLDGDTIISEDLQPMLALDMRDCYVGGIPCFAGRPLGFAKEPPKHREFLESFGIDSSHWVCSGVMLMNLEKLREDGCVSKFIECVANYDEHLHILDESVINAVCFPYILDLPFKYGMFNCWPPVHELRYWAAGLTTGEERRPSHEKPAIIHFTADNKPWLNDVARGSVWWRYVPKAPLSDEIKDWAATQRAAADAQRQLQQMAHA
ncbi:MAG: glycosyltransferase family 8 protein [Oscillospiraceae bacterium]|nr:glycosyltransferase family 8 protein [Oscillospiraceae bacterium]